MTSFRFVTALLVAFSIWEPAFAFPLADRPIRLIVPFAAGGSTDVMAREIGRRLSQRLSVPVIIENKSGGGTTIAAAEVSRAVPDGHTLLYTTLVTFALNPHLLKSRGYDAERDFTPITGITTTNIVLLSGSRVNAKSLGDFVAAAKKAEGKMTYGSIGLGSVAHLYGAYTAKAAGIELIHVPYRGSAPASQDFLGGQIDALFDPIPAALPKLINNQALAIAIAAKSRSPLLPDLPTFEEQGSLESMKRFGLGCLDLRACRTKSPGASPPKSVQFFGSEMCET